MESLWPADSHVGEGGGGSLTGRAPGQGSKIYVLFCLEPTGKDLFVWVPDSGRSVTRQPLHCHAC